MRHVSLKHLVPFLVLALGACTHGNTAAGKSSPTGDAGSLVNDNGASASDASSPSAGSDAAGPSTAQDAAGADATGPTPHLGDAGIRPGASSCNAITVAAGTPVDGTKADTFQWSDADCQPRSAALLRNDGVDAYGEHGGYMRSYSYVANGKARLIKGTGANGFYGFGYAVNHYGTGSQASVMQDQSGTWRTLLAGPHHAIHEFQVQVNPGGPVNATIQWFFSTGRSHPLYAVTFDATPAGANMVKADSRAPYGDMAWDDGQNGVVDGLGWGDAYQLITTDALSPTSTWDYTKPNVIPYAFEWSAATDAEMGLVSTESYAHRVQGGDYWGNSLSLAQGKTGAFNLDGSAATDLPVTIWPYQLNQYQLPYGNTSHRLAWGDSFGAVGQSSYTAFGQMLSGYPYHSYTIMVVLGTHASSAVMDAIADMEAVQKTTLTATRGSVVQSGPAGIGRSDTATYAVAGFDPVYAAWTLNAEGNAAAFSLDTHGSVLKNPVVVLRGYDASGPPTEVTLAGKALHAGQDYFATVDAAGKRLWLTLNGTLDGTASLTVE